MSDPARKELHELVDALPAGEEQVAKRFLQYLRDLSDPYVELDRTEPLADLTDDDRARLHAALAGAEKEVADGQSLSAEEFLKELRARR